MFERIGDDIYYDGKLYAKIIAHPAKNGGWVLSAEEALFGVGPSLDEMAEMACDINDCLDEVIAAADEVFEKEKCPKIKAELVRMRKIVKNIIGILRND
jgi:hypothetical protein